MLYQSLKQTIIEYDQKKKQNQPSSDKRVFKWKVLALGFCILVIVLIGILSQLIQGQQEDLSQKYNTTFLPQLLRQSTQLEEITSIKNLVSGINTSSRVIYDKSDEIMKVNTIVTTELLNKIDKKSSILFILNLRQEDKSILNFGMLLKRQYDSQVDPIQSVISIEDSRDDLTSVLFNLNKARSMRMNLQTGCKLYSFNQTTKDLSLLQFLHIQGNPSEQGEGQLNLSIKKSSCFGTTQIQALTKIKQLTGVSMDTIEDVNRLTIDRIQVFHLTLNGQNVE